ncbi:MAG TPA: squalene synthase HpnC [Acidobacteriaceae bacterium]|jgi:squalene synthase HpnC|nr:squalene synthase HpnC [Acidobacteriaceae bacterium]
MTVEATQHDLLEKGWAALPPDYGFPAHPPTLEEARAWCRHLAETHYENFHVASWFLPKRFRPHFHSIYAYCRVSDDLGDEVGDRDASLALLDLWGAELDACYRGESRHPVFVALAETIRACDIPKEPFADLLVAFRRDQTTTRFATRQDVLGYCRYSANPVGRLVLYACGYCDPERFALSDQTCSALQLANFWQDIALDYSKGRIYLPLEDMARYGVDEQTIAARTFTPQFRELMRYQVDYARRMFHAGLPLIGQVDRELAVDLDLFSRGGLEILRAIERQDYDVLRARPSISKPRKAALLLRALSGKFFAPRATSRKAA